MRPIFSDSPCTYSSTTKPLKLFSGRVVNALWQFCMKDMGYLLSRRTALTRCVSSRLHLFVDEMLFALLSKVLIMDLLWHKG